MIRAPRCGALVLAAGRARRFGSDKRRARLPSGHTLLAATLNTCIGQVDEVRLVLAPADDADELLADTRLGTASIVRAADSHLGMGHSIATGIKECRDWDAALIVLADMPWVGAETIAAIIAAWRCSPDRQHVIVRPRYRGQNGHPVCFGAAHFDALARCSGDRGAATLVQSCRTRQDLELADPGMTMDADTPQALTDACREAREPPGHQRSEA